MLKAHATIEVAELAQETWVRVWWDGVALDRPQTYSILVGAGKRGMGAARKLADRLAKAVEAQVVFTGAKVATDVNGRTFVSALCQVRGRTLGADLRRLGF